MLTGESIFQGFIRLNRGFAFFLWILMTLSFLWFGAFAAAGGTSMAALTDFPAGWSRRGQTLFWAYALDRALCLGDSAEQSDLPAGRRLHVGRGAHHVDRTAMGLRAGGGVAALPAFLKGLVVPEGRCRGLGTRPTRPNCSRRSPSRASAVSGRSFIPIGYATRDRDGALHGPAHRPDHRQSRRRSPPRARSEQRRRAGPCPALAALYVLGHQHRHRSATAHHAA